MKKLSSSERNHLKKLHKKERDSRVCDRIKAVLCYDEGWDVQKIARALLVNPQTIYQHIQDYRGNQKLNSENGGSSSKLNASQTKELVAHLKSKTYVREKDIIA